MAFGAILSLYDLGGWRLLVALPITFAGFCGASYYSDGQNEALLKGQVEELLLAECPQLPREFTQELQGARGIEFENNKLRLNATWEVQPSVPSEPSHWRIECLATRTSKFGCWSISSLQVSTGGPGGESHFGA